MSLEKFNEQTIARFEFLKSRMKINNVAKLIKLPPENVSSGSLIDIAKIEKVMQARPPITAITDEVNFVNASFNFIDSLLLPPELSLAIGLIISANSKNSIQELEEAIVCLAKQIQNWK